MSQGPPTAVSLLRFLYPKSGGNVLQLPHDALTWADFAATQDWQLPTPDNDVDEPRVTNGYLAHRGEIVLPSSGASRHAWIVDLARLPPHVVGEGSIAVNATTLPMVTEFEIARWATDGDVRMNTMKERVGVRPGPNEDSAFVIVALQDLPLGSVLGEFTGVLVSFPRPRSPVQMSRSWKAQTVELPPLPPYARAPKATIEDVDASVVWLIDASRDPAYRGNPFQYALPCDPTSRFHYPTHDKPANCVAITAWNVAEDIPRVFVVATRRLSRGEELRIAGRLGEWDSVSGLDRGVTTIIDPRRVATPDTSCLPRVFPVLQEKSSSSKSTSTTGRITPSTPMYSTKGGEGGGSRLPISK